ncbi:MAG TPA: flagellar biosynthesis protein FlhA [Vicinamibacterales bacterium]|nr:flagellar biosynthesis protein FlhA [Vicinamibacterales bacterium]
MSTIVKQSKATHLLAPTAVMMVVLLMVVPLPPLILDLLLSVDIGLAVTLLLTSVYVRQPVEFSVFPSLLLLLTLIRLSLNVASTRLVLLNGSEGVEAAGHVIMAFGQFVVGGNFVVGVVIFLVLIAIQYIVINHGAVRISEVTARFTLDAMPGRQMAIDADLNAGLIDEKQARERRERVRREADFYGAMDGAIRFTQRDALAAVLITAVNIVAGLIIGVLQNGMDLATAAHTFTILTVGEGLVTAIPSLLVSMAGGLITTRAAAESNLGEEVAAQLLAKPRPLAAAAGVLTFLALIPGLPKFAFLTVAAVLGAVAYSVRTQPTDSADTADAPPAASDAPEPTIGVDPLSVEVGYALVGIVDEKQGGTLLSRVRAIRKQIATETGIVVPPVRIADNLQLGPRGYSILVKGVEVARGELYAERLLAINPGTATRPLDGTQTREPAFGLPAIWVSIEQRDAATTAGYTVVDATTALSTHLSEIIRNFLPELLNRQQVKEMLDLVSESSPKLVEELVPKTVSIGEVQRVLRQLLRERVPVRDLTTILEAIADAASVTKDMDAITEAVRSSIGRAICRPYQTDKGELPVIGVAPTLEEKLLASLVRTDQGAVLALDPGQAQNIASRIARALEQAMAQPVLLCSPALRPHLWRLFARVLPHLGVLSHNEVPAHIQVVPVATLD